MCPKCKENEIPFGLFLDKEVLIPFKVKVFFINLMLKIKVSIKYCPKCGYLSVDLSQ